VNDRLSAEKGTVATFNEVGDGKGRTDATMLWGGGQMRPDCPLGSGGEKNTEEEDVCTS